MANQRVGSGDKILQAGTGIDYVHYMETGIIPVLAVYTVATVPSAASYTYGMIAVSDGTSNKRLAISDGSAWRFPDGNVVS
jgi:hypothetical protein